MFYEREKAINCDASVSVEINEPYKKLHTWFTLGGLLGSAIFAAASIYSYNSFGLDESTAMGVTMEVISITFSTIGIAQSNKNRKWRMEILPELKRLEIRYQHTGKAHPQTGRAYTKN